MSFKPSIECTKSGNLFYTYKFRKLWLLLLYHDFSKVGAWNLTSDALNYADPNAYSIIGSINSEFALNNGYEFFMSYPETGSYNIWFQKNYPLTEEKEINKKSNTSHVN